MRTLLTVALVCFTGLLFAQTDQKGMDFEHAQNWKEILAKAKAENKSIFVDAYTTWCGPCKIMAAKIFPLDEVGSFYNDNYINVKVQLDTTKTDNDFVKQWYADAAFLMKEYKVRVFPTYLFFSPDGQLVHRAVGSSDAEVFINKGKAALDPNKQYYTLQRKYDAGERAPEFLKNIAFAAQEAYEQENATAYGKAYIATQSNLLTEDNMKFLAKFTNSSKDQGFKLMLDNAEAFDKVLGAGKTDETVRNIILREDVYPAFRKAGKGDVEWSTLETDLIAKYPTLAQEVTSNAKVTFYQSTGNWEKFYPAVTSYMEKYGSKVSVANLNSFAWAVFENCEDMTCVTQALAWSKRSFEGTNNPMYMDTYANILYKLGKKKEAIKAMKETIAYAEKEKADIADYKATLEKMEKGEKTWN